MKIALESCCNLFKIKPFLAHCILPLLRIEDIKIAEAVHAKKVVAGNIDKNIVIPGKGLVTNNIFHYYFSILEEYIQNLNLNHSSKMELFSSYGSSDEAVTYFYPIYNEIKQIHQSNIQTKGIDHLYDGAMPQKKMRFGTFLYFKGVITYRMLLESIEWQKQQRPLLGQIAMQAGFIAPPQFAAILLQTKNGYTFGEIGKSKGLLTNKIITSIVELQRNYNCKLGRYFVDRNIMTLSQVDFYQQKLAKHNEQWIK